MITTTFDKDRPISTSKLILKEFFREIFPADTHTLTFSPAKIEGEWKKPNIVQLLSIAPSSPDRYYTSENGATVRVYRTVQMYHVVLMCQTGEGVDDMSDSIMKHLHDNAPSLGEAGLRDAVISSPNEEPLMVGEKTVYRNVHRISLVIDM